MRVRTIPFVVEATPPSVHYLSGGAGSLDSKPHSCKAFGCPSHTPHATGEA